MMMMIFKERERESVVVVLVLMRVFNALLQVVVMKLLSSSSKSRVFARVRVCCVYLQMRVEIYGERGL